MCGGMGHLSSMCKNKYAMLSDTGQDGIIEGAEDSDFESSDSDDDKKKKKKKT
jgi:hypothetical protein